MFVELIEMVKRDIKSSGGFRGAKSRSYVRYAANDAVSSQLDAPVGTSGGNITVVSRDSVRSGKTDWAAVDALTDREITASVQLDADAVPVDIDWSDALVIEPPRKQAISIRVDGEVLDYFKGGGPGYQRRMNAVLRHFVSEQKRKKKKA